jgi:branched-chain amino acid transport system ATP-binding protein
MLLSIKNITVHYGLALALENVSIEIDKGSVVAIVGANGAGKSTTLKAVSGMKKLTSGEIWFNGHRIDVLNTTKRVRLGIAHVPEGRQLFPFLNVLDNLKLGAALRNNKAEISRDMEEIFEHFPVLKERRKQQAGTLSGGEQQMLAIARGLMSKPNLILMDEPSLGLSPIMIDGLVPIIKNIKKGGVSVLLVEQNVSLTLKVADRAYAMQLGKVIIEGDMETFKNTEAIKKAYLGE